MYCQPLDATYGRDNAATLGFVGFTAGMAGGICYVAGVAGKHYDSLPVVLAQRLGGAAVGSVLGGAFLPAALPLQVAALGGAGPLVDRGVKELMKSSAHWLRA
jgi:hypothetical protein